MAKNTHARFAFLINKKNFSSWSKHEIFTRGVYVGLFFSTNPFLIHFSGTGMISQSIRHRKSSKNCALSWRNHHHKVICCSISSFQFPNCIITSISDFFRYCNFRYCFRSYVFFVNKSVFRTWKSQKVLSNDSLRFNFACICIRTWFIHLEYNNNKMILIHLTW